MTILWKIFTAIALAVLVLIFTIGNGFRFWYFLKCIKIRECAKRTCPYRKYCSKYHEKLTPEDREKIARLIDEDSHNTV